MMKKALSFLLALFVLFSFGVSEASELGALFGNITSLFSADDENAHGVGDRVETDDLVITMTNVMESRGNSYYKPEDGKVFLLIEFSIENRQSKDLTVSSMLCFSAWCDQSLCTIDLDALATGLYAGKTQLDCVIESGKKYTGIVGYQVDQNWKTMKIQFQAEPFFSESITFLTEKQ